MTSVLGSRISDDSDRDVSVVRPKMRISVIGIVAERAVTLPRFVSREIVATTRSPSSKLPSKNRLAWVRG